jgi:hypothetical protein
MDALESPVEVEVIVRQVRQRGEHQQVATLYIRPSGLQARSNWADDIYSWIRADYDVRGFGSAFVATASRFLLGPSNRCGVPGTYVSQ